MNATTDARRFILCEPGTNDSIMGTLTRENAYLTAYPDIHGKAIDDLDVGESVLATYRLSGQKGTYAIVRTA